MHKPSKIFIIDVMAMAFRTYHAFAHRPLLTSQGLPTSAVFGSASFLLKLLSDEKPDFMVMVSDSKEKNFRHILYSDYKANRQEMPADLAVQIPYLFELFERMGIPLIRQAGFEADDLIGSLVQTYSTPEQHCYIVSGDKDFYQLINEHTFLYSPKKGGTHLLISEREVGERFHCKPSQVRDILALWGDGVDNVPGVPGIGEKTAIKLIEQFASIDQLLVELPSISNKRMREAIDHNRERLALARQLVTIKTDIAIELSRERMAVDYGALVARPELYDFCKELEFSSLCERLLKARSTKKQQLSSRQGSNNPPPPGELGLSCVEDEALSEDSPATGNYSVLRDRQSLSEFIARASGAALMAFDTETTGLNPVSDIPIGISFALSVGEACYLPLQNQHLDDLSVAEAVALVRPLFALPLLTKIAHNLKFDQQMLGNIGIQLAGEVGDTMLAAFIHDASEASFSLDELSAKYSAIRKIPIATLIGKKHDIPMSAVPLDQLSAYACQDADCCLRLYHYFFSRLSDPQQKALYRDIELPLVPILADMEKTGIFVDREILAGISRLLNEDRCLLEEEIYQLAGEIFNINSPKQLQTILFEKLAIPELLGIKRLKKTKHGYSTDVSVLEALAAHPLPEKILTYRSVTKLQNTYVEVLPKLIDGRSGRVHTSFHQTGTSTGRLSSSNPNLQNIPIQSAYGREIRKAFRGQHQRLIVSADYSQIELRILAHIADDENLRRAFAADQDIHTLTAAQLLHKDPATITHGERSQAKAINYGVVYGMGPHRLAQEIKVSHGEAKRFIDNYFAHFPKIENYIADSVAFATEHGYSETILKRRRRIFGLDGSQGSLAQASARNIAINAPIQGSAADLIKLAMKDIYRDLLDTKLSAKLLLQVHDELVFECPPQEWEELRGIVTRRMEQAYPLSVPLKVNIAAGKNWLEAH